MSDPVRRFLAALRGHGYEPRKSSAGWACRCPAHDDRTPSLSIDTGRDGRALVRCHAGCSLGAVCGTIGLRPADLFPDDPGRLNGHAPKPQRRGDGDESPRKPARGGGSVTDAGEAPPTFPTAAAVAELERRKGHRSAQWTYPNAGGKPVGLVLRWDTPHGKVVRPVSRTADGSGWILRGMPTPRPLYALPELLAAPAGSRVWVCEGEKAAEAARAVGLMATTSPHGSESAAKADWSPVKGRDVVILPDRDDAGELYAAAVARLAMFALTPGIDDTGDERPRLVLLADDGKRAWVTFYNEHAGEQVNLSGDEAAAWSKLEGYAARLALVVHLTRWAAGDPTLRDAARVDEASIAAGVVLARWFGEEARRVYAILAESDDERDTRRLVELIQRKGGDVNERELVQASRMFPTVADAEAALTRLVDAGSGSWRTPEQRGRGGPKARRFVLHPAHGVNVYRNPAGDAGKANPVDVDGTGTATNSGDDRGPQ